MMRVLREILDHISEVFAWINCGILLLISTYCALSNSYTLILISLMHHIGLFYQHNAYKLWKMKLKKPDC